MNHSDIDIEMERATLRGEAAPELAMMLRPLPPEEKPAPSRTIQLLAGIAWVSFFLMLFILAMAVRS